MRTTLRCFTLSTAFLALTATAADLTIWPNQYTIRPWETTRLTASDVVGPDGIVYPDFTGVGVTGGIPDVNNSTVRGGYTVYNVKNYGAIGNGTTNDDAAVASAVTAVKANATAGGKSILYFPTGTYLLSKPIAFGQNSNLANTLSNNIVVDGDGPTASLLKIATDTSVAGGSLFTFKKAPNYGGQMIATAFVPRGANSASFPSDPATMGYSVGSWVNFAASVFGAGTTMSDRFNNPDNHVIYADPYGQHTGRAFLAKVVAVNSATKTITFDRTFTHDYFLDEAPRIRNYTVSEYCGVQDLTIETIAASATIDTITFDNAANCWIKNIKTVKCRNYPYILVGVTRFDVRDSQFLGTWVNIGSGANAYLGWLSSTDSLMDNCQASDLRHLAIFQYANRSVIRNCNFTGRTVQSPQLHGRFPHDNLVEGTTFAHTSDGVATRGITAYASDGAASLRHGVEGPRNVFYNNRVNTGMGTAKIGGLKQSLIFVYNRILKTDDAEAQPSLHIADRSFGGVVRGNVFQAITSMPFMSLEDPTCPGWSVTDNKIYGSNGYLYEGDSAPELTHNNRFFTAATTPDAATTPEVASIYSWQKTNAATPRLVLVIDRRTVTDTGGTTTGNIVRVRSSTASALTVNLTTNIAGLSVPSSVSIPAGQVSASFTITGVGVSGGEKLVTLTAAATGLLNDTESVAVLDQNVALPNFGANKWPVAATGLPAGWNASNFGQVTVAGSQTYTAGTNTWQISGGGYIATTDHSSLARSGRRFIYQPMVGDGEIRARITAASGEQQVGLMITDDEASMTEFIWVEPNGRILFSGNGGQPHNTVMSLAGAGAKVVPQWLRIKRTGFVFTVYKSTATNPTSEADWTTLTTVDMYRDSGGDYKSPAVLDQRMYCGMFINSGSPTTAANATFTGLQILSSSTSTSQSISFNALSPKSFGDSAFNLTATATSGLPVSYTSSNSAVATVSGSTVTIVGAGSTTITASQAGNGSYSPAPDVVQTLTVNPRAQSITFGALAGKTYGDASFNLSATASSGLSVSYSSSNLGVATISGSTVSIVGAGSTTITASQSGNANYSAATNVAQTLTVGPAAQSITFGALASATMGDTNITLGATASSGQAVTYTSSNTGVATVSGNVLSVVGAGSTVITASQNGNVNYTAATPVGQPFTVDQATQTITFPPLPAKTMGDPAFSLAATASSGLTVSYASENSAVATVSGSTVTIVGAGTTMITASQTGNTNYSAAPNVTQILTVTTGALLVEEHFNYTLGATNPDPDGGGTVNGGNGLPATNVGGSPSGTSVGFYGSYGSDQTVTTGLTYSNTGGALTSSGNALRRNSGTSFSAGIVRNYRLMAVDPFSGYRSVANTNTFGWNGSSARQLYFSVLLNVSAINTGADNRLVLNMGLDNSSWNVYLAQANGTGKWRFGDQAGTGADLGLAAANQTVLIVGRLSFNSATQFVTEYWFNPTLGQPLGTATFAKTYTTTTSGGQFNAIQTRDGANILTIDEFRLGTSYASVTPHSQVQNQTITFPSIPAKTFTDAAFALAATASSGLPVSYVSDTPGVATVSGDTVTIHQVGTAIITASQAGNASFSAAPDVTQTLTVSSAAQTITFGALAAATVNDLDINLTGTASSGLPVTYVSTNENVATVAGNIVDIIGAGSAVITASQEGNTNYSAATDVSQTLTVNPASQTITFGALGGKTVGDAEFNLTATATSGLTVGYTSSNTAVATVSGNSITIVGAGSTLITASQEGNANYTAASNVTQSLTVGPASQTITFGMLAAMTVGDADFNLTATASSGLTVTYTSSNTGVATVSGSTVHVLAAGSTVITARQSGNTNYLAASDVNQTLVVNAPASFSWVGGAGNWSSTAPTAGWNSPIIPNATGAVANLSAATGNVTVNGAYPLGSLTAGGSFNARTLATAGGNLTFDVASGNALFDLTNGGTGGSGLTVNSNLTLNDNLEIRNLVSSGSQTPVLAGIISGNGGLLLTNIGTTPSGSRYDLRGTNTFAGGINIGQNVDLRVNASGAMGSGTVTRASGVAGGTNSISFRRDTANATQVHANNIDLGTNASGSTTVFTVQDTMSVTLTGIVSGAMGSGNRANLNGGTLILSGSSPNTWTNQFRSDTHGTIIADKVGALNGGFSMRSMVDQTTSFLVGVSDTITGALTLDGNNSSVGYSYGARIGLKDGNNGTVTLNSSTPITLNNARGIGGTDTVPTTSLTLHSGNGTGRLDVSTHITETTGAGIFRNIRITGTGVVSLNRASGNSYKGTTTVSGGTLLANNTSGSATGTGAVSVESGGRLGGAGIVGGNVTLQAGGGLTFTLSTAPASHDGLDLLGSLNLGASPAVLLLVTSNVSPGTYSLVTASTGITGTLPIVVPPDGFTAQLQLSGDSKMLNLILLATQSITFNALPSKQAGDPAFSLSATASSGLGVTYSSSNTSVATIAGSTVTIVGVGTSLISASQSGNATYDSAPDVTQVLTVSAVANDLTGTSAALTGANIGAGSNGAATVLSNGGWWIDGSGAGPVGSSDGVHFEGRPVVGDMQMLVCVQSVTSSGSAPRAGLMLRESNLPGSRQVYLAIPAIPSGNYIHGHRAVADAASSETTATGLGSAYSTPNVWCMLQRSGDTVSIATATSSAGPFTQISSITLTNLAGSLQAGVFTSSGTSGVNARAVMTGFLIIPLDVNAGLSARWRFENNLLATPVDYNGAQVGSINYTDGKLNSHALNLTGSNTNYVNTPTVINPQSGDFTACAWVKLTAAAVGNSQIIIQQLDTNGTGRTWIYRNSVGKISTFIGNAETTSTSVLAADGLWHHVAVVKSGNIGNNVQIFIDGVADGTPAARVVEFSQGGMRIGAHKVPSTSNQTWNGGIDDVRIYNRALVPSEILTISNWTE